MDPVEVDPVDVKERSVDPQGRVSVGTDYAGETVRVAVIETVDATTVDLSDLPELADRQAFEALHAGLRFLEDGELDEAVEDLGLAVERLGGSADGDGSDPVTVCEDCGEMWAGRTTYCDDCGSEKIRQVEPREQSEQEWSA